MYPDGEPFHLKACRWWL